MSPALASADIVKSVNPLTRFFGIVAAGKDDVNPVIDSATFVAPRHDTFVNCCYDRCRLKIKGTSCFHFCGSSTAHNNHVAIHIIDTGIFRAERWRAQPSANKPPATRVARRASGLGYRFFSESFGTMGIASAAPVNRCAGGSVLRRSRSR